MLLTYKPLLRAISYIGEGWQNSSRSFYFSYRWTQDNTACK